MIKKTFFFAAAFSLGLFPVWIPSETEAAEKLVLKSQSVLWLKGDSTLHHFYSTTTALAADLEAVAAHSGDPKNLFLESLKNGELKKFVLRVPVNTLKSGESRLDKNMYEALKAKENPEITFRMAEYALKPADAPGEFTARVKGVLTVAGKGQEMTLEARGKAMAGGAAKLSGMKELLMTDFGVQPPSMMMGAVKTDNRVEIFYELQFAFEEIK